MASSNNKDMVDLETNSNTYLLAQNDQKKILCCIDKSTFWKLLTISLLIIGYIGIYITDTSLSVATPLIIDDPSLNITSSSIGIFFFLD